MNYSQAIQYLFGLERFGWKLGLDRMQALLADLGNPHHNVKSIHIAGTNGKGSVSAMLASIFSESGYKTGLYTSPHLVDARERIQLNGENISEPDFLAIIVDLKPFFDKHQCTFFEAMTALAFYQFSKLKVDVAVIEVGLGGRLDATNVIEPLLTIITNIGYDHTEHLGNELHEIAGEKAGIIKSGTPCVVGEMPSAALDKIKEIAGRLFSPIVPSLKGYNVLNETPQRTLFDINGLEARFEIPLAGKHMLKNALIAITAARQLENQLDQISLKTIAGGLAKTNWPGRFQIVNQNPIIILDVAHNKDSMIELKEMLKQFFPHKNISVLFGLLEDKNVDDIVPLLATVAKRCYVGKPDSERAQSARLVGEKMIQHGVPTKMFDSILEGLDAAFEELGKDEVLCITGSHYVVGQVLPQIKSLTHKYIINKF